MTELEESLGQLEGVVFGLSLILSGIAWLGVSVRAARLSPMVDRGPRISSLLAGFLAMNAVNFAVLLTLASADVRSSVFYIVFYLAMGLGASVFTLLALKGAGVSRRDIHERGNRAAATLEFSALVAGGVAFAGANIGDGPGFWVVIICAALSMGTLFALALLHIAASRTIYRILVDRERGTAFRFGCLLVGCALVLGRAVAGDWTGIGPAIVDFSGRAWPAAIMVLLDVVVARVLLSREPDGNAAADRAFGVIYLLMGCVFVAALGKPT